jgi:hypothetical protein
MSSKCVARDLKKLGIKNGRMYHHIEALELYYEQEGMIEDAIEHTVIEGNGVNSGDSNDGLVTC